MKNKKERTMPRLKSKPKSKFKLKKVPKLKLKSMPKPVWNREHQLKELPSLTNVGSVPLEHLLGASHSMHLGFYFREAPCVGAI